MGFVYAVLIHSRNKAPLNSSAHAVASDWSATDQERAVLVHQTPLRCHHEDLLDELSLLAESAGAVVCDRFLVVRKKPDPASYVGSGKLEEIRRCIKDNRATLVVIDHSISPVQERNLEREFECRVLDRTGLILDIFAQRATSHEGKLQVELAQLRHLSTRLIRGWTHLERQKGGIGLRGPGETQLETDRRLIGKRIKTITRRLARVRAQRTLRRRSRNKIPIPTVSFVGYTNAGKSSLFNCISESNVYAADKLFATLDPTMRRVEVPGFGAIVLSDTVGFIRGLPHGLVSAFHSTLEEVVQAALLIHVVDVTNSDRREQMEQVTRVLTEIGADDVPMLTVYNKVDCVDRAASYERNAVGEINTVWLSAHTGEGVEALLTAIAERLGSDHLRCRLRIPVHAGELRARLYSRGQIIAERTIGGGDWLMDIRLSPADVGWLQGQADYKVEFWQ